MKPDRHAPQRNLIGGEGTNGSDMGENHNPAKTDEVAGLYARGSKAHARDAIAAAPRPFRSGRRADRRSVTTS